MLKYIKKTTFFYSGASMFGFLNCAGNFSSTTKQQRGPLVLLARIKSSSCACLSMFKCMSACGGSGA